ncbi:hypothetical protein CAPTEDRAFT_203410 [Capitella teleta]|uniref:IF rod domain-containing protein n=1 Tax=Capitella teleta TaxID=283909 RepID=R7VIB8_CAPTE|nr:hypothetical protein CAPTEDRAFT_203410 [Capitella teleta]|eukprot:ELU15460.1 hypothetical protein CAPTEDRAFT_203410 [Capitella teleta]
MSITVPLLLAGSCVASAIQAMQKPAKRSGTAMVSVPEVLQQNESHDFGEQVLLQNLRNDNSKLFSKAIEERNEVIRDLEKGIFEIREAYTSLEKKFQNAQEESHNQNENQQREIEDLKRKIKEKEESLTESNRKLQQQMTSKQNSDQSTQMKLMTLAKEKDDLLELAMSRGKIIQEKQTENRKLQQKIFEMEKCVQKMQEKFERDAALVDVNLQVRRLKAELSEVNGMYDDAVQEFNAYRKHSTNLLEKEKELNSRLRHLCD